MKIRFSLIIAIVVSFVSLSRPAPAQDCPQHCDAGSVAVGFVALNNNTTGSDNVAIGEAALASNTTGTDNIAIGFSVFQYNIDGRFNIAMGTNTMNAHTTGDNNIGIGIQAGKNLTTGSNNIDIANLGVASESKTIRIGTKATHRATYIAGISGATVAGGIGVVVDSSGHLGTVTSSARFKDQIKPMGKVSEAILALQPVTFRYKDELDPKKVPQFGLVAEQVEKVNPDLVARDEEGKPYTVRYEAVNAMLLNEFLKEHRKVEEQGRKMQEQEATITQLKSSASKQEATIGQLKSTVAQQQEGMEVFTATLKEQASQIQKVSAQLKVTKRAPQMVVNN